MSGGSTQPTQTTTTQISPQAQQLFNLALPGVQNFAASPPPAAYPGETVAPFTPAQTSGQSQLISGAENAGDIADWSKTGVTGLPANLSSDVAGTTPFVGADVNTSSDIFSDPGIWNPQFNTGLNEAQMAATRPLYQQLTEQALPAIRTTALSTGPTMGSREGIAEGLATGRTAQAASDVTKKIAEDEYAANLAAVNARYGTNIGAENQRYGTNVGAETARYGTDIGAANQRYGTNINALLAAYGLAPSLQQQQLVPGATTSAVGDVQQQLQQAILTGKINKYNYEQLAPFLQSQEILSLIQGIPGGSTTSTGNVPTPNLFPQVLGGAGTGAAIGSAIMPGAGTAVGAGAGALLPFLFNRQ